MPSSAACSPLRLELKRSRWRVNVLAGLAALAAFSVWLSALPTIVAVPLWSLCALVAWFNFRGPEPLRLRWQSNDSLWLDWSDESEVPMQLVSMRRVGTFTVLRWKTQATQKHLVLWPDSLALEDRKALRRRLQGGMPGVDSG